MTTQKHKPFTYEEKTSVAYLFTLIIGVSLGYLLFHQPPKIETTPLAVCPESQIVETDKNLDKWDALKRTDDTIFMHSAGIIAACGNQDAQAIKIHADAITKGLAEREEVTKSLGY